MTTFGCDEFREMAPDLALGLLAGDERAAAINHVAGCASCRRHLNAMVQVTDELLLLAPSIDPDIGFESRVVARLADQGAFAPATAGAAPATAGAAAVVPLASARRPASKRRRMARPWTVGIAAAVAVLVGVTGWTGWSRGHEAGRVSAFSQEARAADQLAARTAVVWSDEGHSWCNLVAFPGHGTTPAQLVVQLDEPGQTDVGYQVMAVPVDGKPAVLLGTINVVDGQGRLTASVPPGTGQVNAIQVVEGPNSVKYRATFAAI